MNDTTAMCRKPLKWKFAWSVSLQEAFLGSLLGRGDVMTRWAEPGLSLDYLLSSE